MSLGNLTWAATVLTGLIERTCGIMSPLADVNASTRDQIHEARVSLSATTTAGKAATTWLEAAYRALGERNAVIHATTTAVYNADSSAYATMLKNPRSGQGTPLTVQALDDIFRKLDELSARQTRIELGLVQS